MTTPSLVLNSGGEKKKINICKIVATFVYASSQGQRTHSARTNYKMYPTFYLFLGQPQPSFCFTPMVTSFSSANLCF
jgi:hypothetical protein